MVIFTLKTDFDESLLETGALCIGYKKMVLLGNAGPFPHGSGGHCLFMEADGEVIYVNSADLIHDMDAYELSREN